MKGLYPQRHVHSGNSRFVVRFDLPTLHAAMCYYSSILGSLGACLALKRRFCKKRTPPNHGFQPVPVENHNKGGAANFKKFKLTQ